MPPRPTHAITALLQAWQEGDETAQDALFPLIYDELKRLARRHMSRERPGHALQATALVNEAYLRLIDIQRVHWHDRAHFFAVAARVMRRILVEDARARRSRKRGDGLPLAPFDEALRVPAQDAVDLVGLHEALTALAAVDARKSRVVELRFFGGLTAEETAAVLDVSPETVLRDWKLAKVWLLRELKRSPAPGR
jgi:RNA polymerase sigma-70 factor, ECF subfamily